MKRINVTFDDREASLISALQKEYGGSTPQIIRTAVKVYFDKAFPAHARAARGGKVVELLPEEEQLTPEQYCEQKGGRVETVNGIPMCILQISKSMQRKVPLSSVHTLVK